MVTGLPEDLLGIVSHVVGEIAAVTDRSWARPESAVWQITGRSGDSWFVKRHHSRRFHHREVTAYRRWTGALGSSRVPALAAANDSALAIIISGLPGQPAQGLAFSLDEEREVHYQAGGLLRRFHQAAQPADDPGSIERAVARVEEHLHRAQGLLSTSQIQLVRRAADRLQHAARGVPAVPTHGDVQPRNWIWDQAGRQLAFIDFERAELAPAVRDLVRLEYGPWDRRPDLREAFLDGYGRTLGDNDRELLECLAALDALSGIQWGPANNDPDVTSRGWRTLERLSLHT